MTEWKECKLGEMSEITSSKRIYYSEYVQSGIPFWRSKEVIEQFNRKPISTDLFISKEKYLDIKSKFGVPQVNDILLTSVGTLGIPYIVKNEDYFYFKDGNLIWIRNINPNLLIPNYLYIWISSQTGRDTLSTITIGSTQEALTIIGLKNLDILLPPLPEQRAIASVLSSLDDKIDLLHRQNKTLEAMAETLFRQWFIEEANDTWEMKTVSDIIEVRDGTHDSPKQTEIGKYLITSKHLKATGIDFPSAYKISERDYDEINKRSKVDKNDILFSMIGTLGLIHFVDKEPNYAIKNMGLFKSSQKPFFARFLYLLLNSYEGKKFIHENADGSTQEYISLGSLRNFEFKYSGEKRITAFDSEVMPVFRKIENNSTQIRTLESIRDTLLPKLMSGEVRVEI